MMKLRGRPWHWDASVFSTATMRLRCAPRPTASGFEPSLPMIVEHLAARKNEGQNEEKDFDFKSLLGDTDMGRVAWRNSVGSASGHGGWRVRYYCASHGKHRYTAKHLQIPRLGLSGEPFTTADIETAAKQVLRRAQLQWNRLDASEEPRYVI